MTDGMLTAINTVSAPPMNVRNAETINSDLSNKALPYAYISNPGYNFMNPTTLDDVSYSGCRYVSETVAALRENNPEYVTYAYLADDIRQPVADALELPIETVNEASFYDMYHYTDAIRCMEF